MKEFIGTIASIGCLPQLVIAILCFVAMTGVLGYWICDIVKDILR